MSFLYPLFLAGFAAVGLPIILHMIRRHTRKRVTFSSLMFLRTTLPRFKNRSRLENLPLLALRCAILCLLAFGFSRPFFRRPAPESQVHIGRRIVLLIDTSASMRRAGMWTQAISEARSVLADMSQADRVCVMSFSQSPQTLIGFEEWTELDPKPRASVVSEHISKLSPGWASTDLGRALVAAAEGIQDDEVNDGQESMAVRQVVLISDLQRGSSLEALSSYEWPEGIELVVKLIRCQDPTNASLQLVTNPPDSIGGHLAGPDGNDLTGIAITNSPDATKEFFSLNWAPRLRGDISPRVPAGVPRPVAGAKAAAEAGGLASGGADVYVPAGHSIVVRIPTPKDRLAGGKLILTGDDHDFDNALYLAPHLQQHVNILYIGSDDANDSGGMLYYVQRAFGGNPAIVMAGLTVSPASTLAGFPNPRVTSHPAGESLAPAEGGPDPVSPALGTGANPPAHAGVATAHLIIVAADGIQQAPLISLRQYLESGGTVLLVMKSADAATTLAGLTGIETIESEEADVGPPKAGLIRSRASPWYAMLGQIELEHPLLACFREPRFGDFTQIHFWKYRRLDIANLPGASVLAWFDSNDPAWFELHVGKGTLLVLTSGWHPSDSQLALSSKFVPLLYSILEYGGVLSEQPLQYFVGDHISVPHRGPRHSDGGVNRLALPEPGRVESANLKVRRPDDSLISLDASQQNFTQTDLPGIYAIESSAGSARSEFAINLPRKESQTAAMPIEDLEKLGISLSREVGTVESRFTGQQSRRSAFARTGLEYEQKVWRWVFIALLAVSLIEIWLAGWLTRPPSLSQGEQK
jgi:hypothetical protein